MHSGKTKTSTAGRMVDAAGTIDTGPAEGGEGAPSARLGCQSTLPTIFVAGTRNPAPKDQNDDGHSFSESVLLDGHEDCALSPNPAPSAHQFLVFPTSPRFTRISGIRVYGTLSSGFPLPGNCGESSTIMHDKAHRGEGSRNLARYEKIEYDERNSKRTTVHEVGGPWSECKVGEIETKGEEVRCESERTSPSSACPAQTASHRRRTGKRRGRWTRQESSHRRGKKLRAALLRAIE
ncbi:hypothetical protein B0H16DRAFT_1457608 [Mycena metata]|uniref:Uncharacterized protein n=1 Tax=Mycena metata TaxID=1033252 RepID=A0AAD7J7V6_9AGAR|nr:hypothetical protein B0H16DRAFT_1457608 [Mycena metata]